MEEIYKNDGNEHGSYAMIDDRKEKDDTEDVRLEIMLMNDYLELLRAPGELISFFIKTNKELFVF